MQVAGVDGCPAGWLIVRAEASGRLHLLDISIVTTFEELIASTRDCAAVAVDIPIGLSDDGRRQPDIVARQLLRPLRHSSVFPAPVRPVLAATSYAEACAISASARPDDKQISKQTYAILPKIRQADDAMTPVLQERIVEVHPEVSFCALNNHRPLRQGKKSPAGALRRLGLISGQLDFETEQTVVEGRATFDDFLDACAAAWTAGRVAHGTAERLPSDPPRDSRGLRMEIVY
ncbi:MAG: DUF429 domain-containing protein [Chloroflexi bacterium]|nr:DUF429 domain-containing protein [Chloroflexota bacterium]